MATEYYSVKNSELTTPLDSVIVTNTPSNQVVLNLGVPDPYSNAIKYTRVTIYETGRNATLTTNIMGTPEFSLIGYDGASTVVGQVYELVNGVFKVDIQGKPPKALYNNKGKWAIAFKVKSKPGFTGTITFWIRIQYLKSDMSSIIYKDYASNALVVSNANGTTPPDNSPTNLTATAIGFDRVRLNWDTPPRSNATVLSARGYSGGSWNAWTDFATVGGTGSLEYVRTGLTPLTDYEFRAMSKNEIGSAPSYGNVASVKTLGVPSVPSPTIINAITPITFSTVIVDFATVPEVYDGVLGTYPNTYNIYWRKTSDPDAPVFYSSDEASASDTTVEITGLEASTSYSFYITVSNSAGESARSPFVVITTPINVGPPTAPTSLVVVTQDYINQQLTWTQTDASNILGTGVRYSTDGGVTWTDYLNGTFLPPGTTSLLATGLQTNTTYDWAVFTWNQYDGTSHYSASATDSESTGTPPADPDTPVLDSASPLSSSAIMLNWTPGANGTQTGFIIKRGVATGGPYTNIATVGADVTSYSDNGLASNSRYYYVVQAKGYVNNSSNSNELSATTLYISGDVRYFSGFTLHEDSRNRIVEAGGRAIITSDRDRWIIRDQIGNWYKAGLRPIRGTVTLTDAGSGSLENGTYRVYLVLRRGNETRSVPSEPSAEITVSGNDGALVVTPPLNIAGDEVECRDRGFDLFGNDIAGADYWEIYVAEKNANKAYLVAELPLKVSDWEDTPSSGTYSIDPTLTKQDIFGGTRRPMEIMGESSLPPSCWEAVAKDNRIVATGEVNLVPTQDEVDAGATLTIAGGDKHFDLTDWDATDACLYKRLFINDLDTGWEIYDYDTDSNGVVETCYIRNSDPSIESAGFQGAGGSFVKFSLIGNPNRVYTSAYFSGEALAQLSYSPETFPPLTIYEGEFFPEDNTSPNGLISIGGALMVGKPDKWIAATGGDEPDYPIFTTTPISRGSGLNAPFSMTRDANDVCYYLGDTGPFRVTLGGVEKVNVAFGNTNLYNEIVDMSSVGNAIGAWFSREDWYVIVGLNRRRPVPGSQGQGGGFGTCGLVVDVKNRAILPFETSLPITHIKEYKNENGEFQLFFGTTNGRTGYLFKKGLYTDGTDYTAPYPTLNAATIRYALVTGILDTDHALVPRSVQPRIKTFPSSAAFPMTFEVDSKLRCDDPTEFVASDAVQFTTPATSDHISLAGQRCEQAQFRFSGSTLKNNPGAYFHVKELPVEVVVKNAS